MNKQECPVCGEEVDLDNEEAVVAHMDIDNDAHREHKEAARKKMNTSLIMDQLCATGILRRVRR